MIVFPNIKVLLFISITIAATTFAQDVTERFEGPFDNTFGNSQCDAIDHKSGTSLKQCLTWCESDHACTAVNFNERHRGGSCVRRDCPVPVKEPTGSEKDPRWKGYSRIEVPKLPSTTVATSPTTSSSTASTATPTATMTTTATPPTTEQTILDLTTLELTKIEGTTLELTTPERTTMEMIVTTPEPEYTPQPPTMTPVSSVSLETTAAGGKIGGRDGRKIPFTSYEVSTTSTASGGKAGGHGMEAVITTPAAPHKSHESGDAWIGLVIALCVILLIGVACAINFIRNKRRSGSQTINLTEAGVGNGSTSTSKKTTVTYSNSGTLPSKDRNPQITITTPHTDLNDKAGSVGSVDDVDGGKSNAAFNENQDEGTVAKQEESKEEKPVEGDNDIIVEKDNSNDELNTNFAEQAEGKGLSNDAFKEDEVVKADD